MPIEIKELKIKAVIAPSASEKKEGLDKTSVEKLKKEIIKECLQEVKALFNEYKER